MVSSNCHVLWSIVSFIMQTHMGAENHGRGEGGGRRWAFYICIGFSHSQDASGTYNCSLPFKKNTLPHLHMPAHNMTLEMHISVWMVWSCVGRHGRVGRGQVLQHTTNRACDRKSENLSSFRPLFLRPSGARFRGCAPKTDKHNQRPSSSHEVTQQGWTGRFNVLSNITVIN